MVLHETKHGSRGRSRSVCSNAPGFERGSTQLAPTRSTARGQLSPASRRTARWPSLEWSAAVGRVAIGRVSPGCVAFGALALGGLACGCGEAASDPDDDLPVTDGAREEVFPDTGAQRLSFEGGSELRLLSGSSQTLRVRITPPGDHLVRFALLGRSYDAFLDRSLVRASEEGVWETTLTVIDGDFNVRAASGPVDALLQVQTLPASVGNLRVVARYEGDRPVQRWTASARVDASCAEVPGPPFEDGPFLGTAAPDEGPVAVDRVPAGRALAVVVRAEQFAGGCRGLDSVRVGADTFVYIDVLDRPLQINDLNLRLALGVDGSPELSEAMSELIFRAVTPLAGGANTDLAALLDAMAERAAQASPEQGEAFATARNERDWQGVLVGALGDQLLGTGLRTQVRDWMLEGLAGLNEPDAFEGVLLSEGTGGARLTLSTVIGLSPADAGFEADNVATITAETDDFLRAGATLTWLPSVFLSAAAGRVALARDPGATSPADALSRAFGCEDVASLLVDAGQDNEAYLGCDQACMLALCRGGMDDAWARVQGSALAPVPWEISGAGQAVVDAEARPARVSGTWVGSLVIEDFGSAPLQGSFSAAATPEL